MTPSTHYPHGWSNHASLAARRGWLLLECLLAIALFFGAALVIFECIGRASDSMELTRRTMRAADVARSAMSRIESGNVLPETLSGPVESETETTHSREAWELEVSTEPAGPYGLMKVTVRAILRPWEGSDQELASFTLVQAVRVRQASEATP